MTRRVVLLLVAAVVVSGIVIAVSHGQPILPATHSPSTTSAVVSSAVLGRDMPIDVYAPPSAAGCADAPLLVLFHGVGGDEHQWMAGSALSPGVGVDSIADGLIASGAIRPLTIVSAAIANSYGVDSAAADDGYSHGPYGTYIVKELLPTVVERYDPHGSRPLYIGGLSMGGYAALNVALDEPTQFAGVGALSPAFFVSPPSDRAWMYSANGRTSLFERADAGAADHLKLFLGVGTDDYSWISAATGKFGQLLQESGVDVTIRAEPGGHEAATWRALADPMLRTLFAKGTPIEGCA